jgi:hypothetical protein
MIFFLYEEFSIFFKLGCSKVSRDASLISLIGSISGHGSLLVFRE